MGSRGRLPLRLLHHVHDSAPLAGVATAANPDSGPREGAVSTFIAGMLAGFILCLAISAGAFSK